MSELLGTKVLLATDSSEGAELATKSAVELAKSTGSELHVIYTEAHLRMGRVVEEIVGLADELEVGLVVVGSRGLGRIRRTLAGSVSESVFRHAHCPVMVVRAKDTPPSQRGGRSRVRRVLSQDLGQASHALARR